MSINHSITDSARLAALAAALLLAAGGASAEGVLRIGTNVGPVTFDPIRTIAERGHLGDEQHERLPGARPAGRDQIVPDLAERWEISDDQLTYTFHLRDAKFSDGSPITASDVVFSLTRSRDDPDSAWSDPVQDHARRSARPIPGPWSSP